MKSEFLLAITQLSAEKNLPKEVIITAVEAALASAYRKNNFTPSQNVSVNINSNTGKVEVWAEKIVVELPSDNQSEISLNEARLVKPDTEIGNAIMVEATPHNAGRIAAQTAKQVILQRLSEAEHSAIFEEYAGKEGDIINGVVQRIEPKQLTVDLGRTEAILPAPEQTPNERYRVGQRLKCYLLEVVRTPKGPRVILSRSHPDLLRRLFELEVPEVFNGTVEIKAIAREAGYRSKVAVASHQGGIDSVGCCVGLRGIRIQNIVSELNGEKLDVVLWNQDSPTFIASALSPAQIISVRLNQEEGTAIVVVPDKQLSLAIGKEGQNARLAAKLTGWRIDIRSASVIEAEKTTKVKSLSRTEEEVVTEEIPPDIPDMIEPIPEPAETKEEMAEEAVEPIPVSEVTFASLETSFVAEEPATKPQIRFAEDILAPRANKSGVSSKKKRKVTPRKEGDEDSAKPRRARRVIDIDVDDEY
ncbi:transcription termination factor NusA [Chloroflexota bacterium]